MNVLQISAVACAFISLLFLLIALGSDYWLQSSVHNTGLWVGCYSKEGCGSFGMDVPDYYHATRAFMFFGMIAGAVSCLGLCGKCFDFQFGSLSKAKTAAIASLVAALCVMIAMATFTGQTGSNASYGWSFGLGWASFPLFLVTGVLAFLLDGSA
ncbi:protein NKG7-like [Zootoca vivipara]|uniref:protein NKG7-like n=1 Tax=Zootoca vivipara TaxID=8524 RepID=UPI00159142B9|nr:protein NKG7-like [Zootoca vivipara]